MELPKHITPDYDNVRERVTLHRSMREWRDARRAQRLGYASFRDVRAARKAYSQARHTMENLYAQGGL
jgi:hypothetical protein